MKTHKQKIVTIGGGTGSFTLLSGLKSLPVDLSAIVSMADDGGSTGILRDEMGVLPPGDIRQCLVALSESSEMMRELFNFRYSSGGLAGHNFGNIFLSTLEKLTGDFNNGINEVNKILRVRGKVIPVTMKSVQLVAELNCGKKISGQHNIDESDLSDLKVLSLKPKAEANPDAIKAIKRADKIIINPGSLFSSIIPNLLVGGLAEAIKKSKAKKIYICNLMNKNGETDNFTVADFVRVIESYLGGGFINYVISNIEYPEKSLLKKYAQEGDFVRGDKIKGNNGIIHLRRKLLSKNKFKQSKEDKIKRTLIRHDSEKLAKIIYEI